MSGFTNGLNAAQSERLALLIEECGEIIQAATKVLRHGYDSHHPFDPEETTNRRLLEGEIGDLSAIIELCIHNDDFWASRIHNAKLEKMNHAEQYLHFNSFREINRG